jgi:hypothetical protein
MENVGRAGSAYDTFVRFPGVFKSLLYQGLPLLGMALFNLVDYELMGIFFD